MKRLLVSLFIVILSLAALSSCAFITNLHTCEGEEMVALEPTCVDEGEMFIVCKTCLNLLDRYTLPATGEHSYGEKIYDEYGYDDCSRRPFTQTCKVCGNVSKGMGGDDAHKFVTETVPPTCDADGYDKSVCTVCGLEVRSNQTTVEHRYRGEYYSDLSFHWQICEDCGKEGDKVAHNMNASGVCTVCLYESEYTPGVIYEISDDGSYAIVTGYVGKYNVVKIAADYEGVPVTHIGNGAFKERYNDISEVVLPDTITYIGDEAFYYCLELDITELPPNLEYIGDHAFNRCCDSRISYIPDSVTYLGAEAFFNCYRMTEITIGDGVTHIGDSAFSHCNNLATVTLGKNVVSIGEMAFYCSGVRNLILSDSTTTIGYCAFTQCTIKKLHIGKSLSDIGGGEMAKAGNLTEITLSEENEHFSLHNGILYNKDMTKMVLTTSEAVGENYTIPDGVVEIGEKAFYKVWGLKSVTIPDSVKVIGAHAFDDCSNLSEINFGLGVEEIGDYAFESCTALTEITFPRNVKVYGTNVFAGTGVVNLVIPDYVTNLGEYAFAFCQSLTSITFGSGIKEIPTKCFYNCTRLERVTIPDGVEVIGNGAFETCYYLFDVRLGNDVKVIEASAFKSCGSLSRIIVGTGLEEIRYNAFNGCEIKFIFYMGTAEQWENVIVGTGNTEIYHFRVYQYSESAPEDEGRYWHYDGLGNPVKW